MSFYRGYKEYFLNLPYPLMEAKYIRRQNEPMVVLSRMSDGNQLRRTARMPSPTIIKKGMV